MNATISNLIKEWKSFLLSDVMLGSLTVGDSTE